MAHASNSREQNYWPGFVDALTNVVLVMVFVVVVFALVTISGMLRVAKATIETQVATQVAVHAKAQKQDVDKREALLRAEADSERQRSIQLQREIDRLTLALQQVRSVSGGQVDKKRLEDSKTAPVEIYGQFPSVTVSFAPGVAGMERKLLSELDKRMGMSEEFLLGNTLRSIRLQAFMVEASPSEARRLAFYRLAQLRDHFVFRGVSPAKIETTISDLPGADGRSQVKIDIEFLQ